MLRRIKIVIIQNSRLSVLNVLVLVILGSFVVFSLIIYNSAKLLKTDTLNQLGITISVASNIQYMDSIFSENASQIFDETQYLPPQTRESLDAVLNIDEVTGIETLNANSMLYALPVNFENSKIYTGENPYEQIHQNAVLEEIDIELLSNSVNIIGLANVEMFDYFRRNLSTLFAGGYPSAENPGAIISMELAEQNNLSLGDIIEINVISNEFNTQTQTNDIELIPEIQSIKITGIYETNLYFDVGEENYEGIEIFKNSPYNAIFTDYNTAVLLNDASQDIRFFTIYVNSYDSIDMVLEQLKDTGIDWDKYQTFVAAETYYADVINQTDSFVFRTFLMVLVSVFVGYFLFYLYICSLNIYKDCAILLTLGESKRKIVFSKCIEYMVYITIAIPISLFVGYFLTTILQTTLMPEVELLGVQIISYSIGSDNYIPNLQVIVTPSNVAMLIIYFVMLLALIAFVVSFSMQNKSIKKMLMKVDE